MAGGYSSSSSQRPALSPTRPQDWDSTFSEEEHNDGLPDFEELPDREALEAFLMESSDEDMSVPDLVDSESDSESESSSLMDPDDVPVYPEVLLTEEETPMRGRGHSRRGARLRGGIEPSEDVPDLVESESSSSSDPEDLPFQPENNR